MAKRLVRALKRLAQPLVPKPILQKWQRNEKLGLYRQIVRPGDLVFDVGANHGNRVELFLELGARVVAVEPQPDCCEHLRQTFGNRISLEQTGLGGQQEVRQLHLCSADTLATFDQSFIDTLSQTRFREENGVRWEGTVDVNMTTLDALIAKYGAPSVVKIDVEGFELEVLKGLTKPVKMLSIEYTVPERNDQLLACLDRLAAIDPQAECNYSIGESLDWTLPTWKPIDAMRKLVLTDKFQAHDFGDVYVRHREAV